MSAPLTAANAFEPGAKDRRNNPDIFSFISEIRKARAEQNRYNAITQD